MKQATVPHPHNKKYFTLSYFCQFLSLTDEHGLVWVSKSPLPSSMFLSIVVSWEPLSFLLVGALVVVGALRLERSLCTFSFKAVLCPQCPYKN